MTGADDSRAEEERPLSVNVLRGAPSDEELAAVVAVLSDSYVAEVAAALADDPAPESAWQRTRRNLRTPLRRDIPWGRFSG